MIYSVADINFAQISPNEFERLCYELLLKYGYIELAWRQGGADNGRDIDGYLFFTNQLYQKKTKWFFECKHYTQSGVPPAELNSKIAWADAERPDYLVIFVSSYITVPARTWLNGIRATKNYDIVVIEGEEIKNRLIQFPELIEAYFSENRFEQLFLDIKKHWLKYHIKPSYRVLSEIATHIDPAKFTLNELGFLFLNFYREYQYFKDGDHNQAGEFNPEVLEPLYDQLIKFSSTEVLELFEEYKDDYSYLGGNGCFDAAEYDHDIDDIYEEDLYQYYDLHLNYSKSDDKWRLGYYVFFKSKKGVAFEIFVLDNSESSTCSKFYEIYSSKTLSQLSIKLSDKTISNLLKMYPDLNIA